MAERLAAEGAAMALLARTRKELDEAAGAIRRKGGKATEVPCDLAVPEEIANAARTCVDALGTLDVLVNNAGVYEGLGRAA